MRILTSAEERKLRELKEERRQTLKRFAMDFRTSFLIWIKISGVITIAAILIYLVAKHLFSWDIFYEMNLDFSSIFMLSFLLFLLSVAACWLVALFLYNTRHRRNTNYKPIGSGRGGKKKDEKNADA